MREVKIVPTTEDIKGNCGILPAGRLLRKFGFERLNESDKSATKPVEYSSENVMISYCGLLCGGERAFYDLDDFRGDLFFMTALGTDKVASESTLHERIDQHPQFADDLRKMNMETVWKVMKPSRSILPNGRKGKVVLMDVDVSVHDNGKTKCREKVEPTYNEKFGFSQIYAYAGEEGYMFDCELRPGSQHCQNGTADFLRNIVDSADARWIKLLFRMDSGNDADENALLCHKRKHNYIIARNPRRADQSSKIEEVRDFGRLVEDSESHTTHLWSDVVFIRGENGGLHKEHIVYRLKTIFKDKKGQPLLFPDEELSSWRTNMALEEEDAIGLYRQHGTSEQYHSELKSDMEMERMPSLSFESNKVVHACCMIAFNVLRKMGGDSAQIIRTKRKRSRLRIETVINEVIRSAGKFIAMANTFFLRMNPSDVGFDVVHELYYAYG